MNVSDVTTNSDIHDVTTNSDIHECLDMCHKMSNCSF